jgi:hypothetical protein
MAKRHHAPSNAQKVYNGIIEDPPPRCRNSFSAEEKSLQSQWLAGAGAQKIEK